MTRMNGQRENVQNSKCKKERGDEKMHLSAARCDPNAKRHLEGTGKGGCAAKNKTKRPWLQKERIRPEIATHFFFRGWLYR